MQLDEIEVQVSGDILVKDTIRFQAHGPVQVFAPQLMGEPTNYPGEMMIPLGSPLVYKGLRDIMNDGQLSYPHYPALGSGNWRGLPEPVYIIEWNYVRATSLASSTGMEIRVTLDHDEEFGGVMATATFYCSAEPE